MELVTNGTEKEKVGLNREQAHILLDKVLDAGFDATLQVKGDDYLVAVVREKWTAEQMQEIVDLATAGDLTISIPAWREVGLS